MALVLRVRETFDTVTEAAAFVADYYKQWHPVGYGTWLEIRPITAAYGNEIEGWRVLGSRSESCD